MSFNGLLPLTSTFPEVDEPERLLRLTDALNESSCYEAWASEYIFASEPENTKAWTPALEERDCKDSENVNEEKESENKESELGHERDQTMEFLTQDSVTAQRFKSLSYLK